MIHHLHRVEKQTAVYTVYLLESLFPDIRFSVEHVPVMGPLLVRCNDTGRKSWTQDAKRTKSFAGLFKGRRFPKGGALWSRPAGREIPLAAKRQLKIKKFAAKRQKNKKCYRSNGS